MWSQRGGCCGPSGSGLASRAEMPAATEAPPDTANEPPSQKSFWTSTISSARVMSTPVSSDWSRFGLANRWVGAELDGQCRLAGGELEPLPWDRDEADAGVFP